MSHNPTLVIQGSTLLIQGPIVEYQLSNGDWTPCADRTDAFLERCAAVNGLDSPAAALELMRQQRSIRNDREEWYSNCRLRPGADPISAPIECYNGGTYRPCETLGEWLEKAAAYQRESTLYVALSVLNSTIQADKTGGSLRVAQAPPVPRPAPRKEGQLWEPCRCGHEPVYMPLMLCERCWPKGEARP